jgi:hypothetical protein
VEGKGKKRKAEQEQPGEAEYRLPPSARAGSVREAALAPYSAEAPRKKNYRLRQSTIDRAMELLGTRNETETIEQALELVVFGRELTEGVRGMRGAGLAEVFGGGE